MITTRLQSNLDTPLSGGMIEWHNLVRHGHLRSRHQNFILTFIFGLAFISSASAQPSATPQPSPLLFHGNYCEFGNNAQLPPVDALDMACARHDACTRTGGLPSAGCNARLEREANAVARDPRQPEDLRALASFVASGAALLPSEPSSTNSRQYAASKPDGYAQRLPRSRASSSTKVGTYEED